MTIRITGMNSGLDTESIIKELASARSMKVENIKKDQTKLSWKVDAWKELNTKIYSLYTDVLSDMRFDYAYAKKTTKVSNPNAVSVVTGGDAVNGVQSMKVKQMATAAYLTGAEVKVGGKKAAGTTKLSELGMTDGAKFKLTVGGKTREIKLGTDETLSDVAKKFSEAGLNAKFDDATGRFFVSAKESGAAGNFKIESAALGIPDGLSVISGLQAVPKKWDDLSPEEKTGQDEAIYNTAREKIITANAEAIKANKANLKNISGNEATGLQEVNLTGTGESGALTDADIDTLDSEGIAELSRKLLTNNDIISGEAVAKQFDAIRGALGLDTEDYDPKNPNWSATAGKGTMIEGKDAEIELNGAKYTSSKNTFEINGLTITAMQETKADETVTLTTQQDTDGIYDVIKNFIKKYNELINEMDKLYNAKSASKYEPLTNEEKDALSETEVEEWEKKIKDSLLRRDTTLYSVSDVMKKAMTSTFISDKNGVNNGKDIYLAFFGIETLGYFKAKDNEKSAYHINGDKDDSSVKNNEEKLKKAIANDPDTVISFFKTLAANLYTELDEKMGRTEYSSAFTFYNDKQMEKELKQYESKITTEQKKLNEYTDRWYKKFSQMEVAMAKLQSKESSLSGLFG